MMPTTSAGGNRRALIISNSSYASLPSLLYSTTNAQDLARKLEKMQFEVVLEFDLAYEQMETTIDDFVNSIHEKDTVIVYFLGHAVSWKSQNYLLPINDDEVTDAVMLQYHAINATKFLLQIIGRDPAAVIFLLDCSYNRDLSESPFKSVGLSSITAPIGSVVVFSSGIGQMIDDISRDGCHGIFIEHLLRHIAVSNLTVGEILDHTRQSIEKETNGGQSLFISFALRSRKTYLNLQHRKAPLCPADINPRARWSQRSIIVAGGHGAGIAANQLLNPWGLYVDDNQTVLVADQLNHRIVEWEHGHTLNGRIIAGGNGPGDALNQLNCPTDVIIDKDGDYLIICDRDNQRIVRWPRHYGIRGQVIISNVNCVCLTMDHEGSLYVSDDHQHEIRRYTIGDIEGTRVAGGNGRGDCLDQFNEPRHIFVDQDRSIYVSDTGNHRVMKWLHNAKEGMIVAGGLQKGHDLTQLYFPQGIIVDQTGALYVADGENKRIVRWTKDSKEASIVIGGNHNEERSNRLNRPFGISFDQHGNLYVVDMYNHRVLQYPIHTDS